MNVLKFNQRATVYTVLQRNTSQRELARVTGLVTDYKGVVQIVMRDVGQLSLAQ